MSVIGKLAGKLLIMPADARLFRHRSLGSVIDRPQHAKFSSGIVLAQPCKPDDGTRQLGFDSDSDL